MPFMNIRSYFSCKGVLSLKEEDYAGVNCELLILRRRWIVVLLTNAEQNNGHGSYCCINSTKSTS